MCVAYGITQARNYTNLKFVRPSIRKSRYIIFSLSLSDVYMALWPSYLTSNVCSTRCSWHKRFFSSILDIECVNLIQRNDASFRNPTSLNEWPKSLHFIHVGYQDFIFLYNEDISNIDDIEVHNTIRFVNKPLRKCCIGRLTTHLMREKRDRRKEMVNTTKYGWSHRRIWSCCSVLLYWYRGVEQPCTMQQRTLSVRDAVRTGSAVSRNQTLVEGKSRLWIRTQRFKCGRRAHESDPAVYLWRPPWLWDYAAMAVVRQLLASPVLPLGPVAWPAWVWRAAVRGRHGRRRRQSERTCQSEPAAVRLSCSTTSAPHSRTAARSHTTDWD